MTQLKILLIETNQKIVSYLSTQFEEKICQIFSSSSGKEGLVQAFEIRPHIIVFEGTIINDIPVDELIQKFKKNPRFKNSLLISFTKNPELFSEENFAFDFVFPKTNAGLKEFVEHIETYLLKDEDSSIKIPQTAKLTVAKSIVFVSAKGGVGLSTTCANIAAFMRTIDEEASVAVLSLTEPYDSFSVMTDYKEKFSIIDLSKMPSSEITPFFLQKKLKSVPNWGFYLLPGFSKLGQAEKIPAEIIQKIMHAFRYAYDYILIDLGAKIRTNHTRLLTSADIVVVVLQPDPLCIAQTRSMIDYISVLGVRRQQLMGIFNHINNIKGFVTSQIEEEVNFPIRHSIPNFGEFLFDNYSPKPMYLRLRNELLTMAYRQAALELMNKAKESYQSRLKTTY